MKPKPILDETGKCQEWLTAGRGIAVWESQEIGTNRPELLTPGDKTDHQPHWAYVLTFKSNDPADFRFYVPVSIDSKQTWSDTPAGWKAASRALPVDREHSAPIGHVYATYTLHRVQLESVEKRQDGRPLCVSFRVGVLHWSYIDKECTCDACKQTQAKFEESIPCQG